MSAPVVQKKEEGIEFDKAVIWNVLKKAQNEGQKYSRKDLRNDCTYIDHDGRWERAFSELVKEGKIVETDEKKKTGRFSSEKVLRAVEPSMKEDIEKVRGGASLHDEG
ncbi:MAG: hypothetical protein Sv326_0075 [Candidatus Fermentimicrarchaeum limneticum]|uniref:Uncharacterized protein n=1 Tax=Fermentimicrarchaeum limneticum TaxID=2795018 RepID=A0A7D5XIX3_FERL1|nr:MAG: hypothetical protein Sv326_0075 [Candidatus Fermentimicrarchaeum limneticum]